MPPKNTKTKKTAAANGKGAKAKNAATGSSATAKVAAAAQVKQSKSAAEAGGSKRATGDKPSDNFEGGKLDLYAMPLDFLREALKPTPSSTPDYPGLLALIREKQAKSDVSARVALALPADGARGYGRFASAVKGFTEPFEDAPYDIGIASLTRVDKLTFTAAERDTLYPAPATEAQPQPGVQGTMVLVDSPCGVASVSGTFKMLLAPVKEGVRMWAGTGSFRVKHGALYQRKGFGSGTAAAFGFWAVEAREGDARALECADLERLAGVSGST